MRQGSPIAPKRLVLVAALLLVLGVQASECARVVVTADPSYPPLHWYDGKTLRGASIDLTVEVLNRLGLPYELRYVGPWRRVLNAAKAAEVDMVVTLKDTPERREYLSYPQTPAFANPMAVFVHNRNRFPYRGPDDLLGKLGGMSLGNRMGGEAGAQLESRLHIEEGVDAEHNFRKLALGRIDYFITGLYAGQAQLATRHDGDQFGVLTPYLVETPNYTAFVSGSPCAKHLAQFDQQLAALAKSGTIAKLIDRNLRLWGLNPVELVKPEH